MRPTLLAFRDLMADGSDSKSRDLCVPTNLPWFCPLRPPPVVLLGVCTPTELAGWPIDAWVVLDCTDQERRQRLRQRSETDDVQEASETDLSTGPSASL
jgi:hypothetical protein